MTCESPITPVDVAIKRRDVDRLVSLNIFSKDFLDRILFEQNDIGTIPMHLEKQLESFLEKYGKASFVLELFDASYPMPNEGREKIDTIFSCPVKFVGE